jgi:Uncharacterised nucleotidyltransferase
MMLPSWVGKVLLLCVREHDWRQPPQGINELLAGRQPGPLLDGVKGHRVVGPAYRSLKDVPEADPELLTGLEALYKDLLRRQLRARADLLSVRQVLDALDTPWLVIKGPVMAEVVYAHRDLRQYHDLDIVVPRASFARAVRALEDAGYRLVDKDWRVARAELAGEVDLTSRFGTPVDLHWDLVYHQKLRVRFGISTEDMFKRARLVEIVGSPFLTLDSADMIIHLCLHGFREGGARLQWLKDIERVLASEVPDWDAVVARARGWQLSPVVGVMLERTRTLLGGDVPEEVLRTLAPRSWRSLVRVADRVSPVERSLGRGSLATIVLRSTRRDLSSSTAALLWTAVERSAQAVHDVRTRKAPSVDSPIEPDPTARAEFFEAVTKGVAAAERQSAS